MYSGNDTVACSKYVYDKTYYQTTKATEWDFVCDKRWMIAIAQVIINKSLLMNFLCRQFAIKTRDVLDNLFSLNRQRI